MSDGFNIRQASEAKDGDLALFIPGHADGAIPNGSRVVKINSTPIDTHSDGATGTVLSSHGPEDIPGAGTGLYCYFVEWDSRPGLPVVVSSTRIRKETP